MTNSPEFFGDMVFGEEKMRERLPAETYIALKKSMENGKELPPEHANAVATAVKDWASEKGVTRFMHWFQPINGAFSEKHESFVSPAPGKFGSVITDLSGNELIEGESEEYHFSSDGLRSAFEIRGKTVWDTNSYIFIKDGILYIPTAFSSHGGEALDKKTPLLRSVDALSKQALRILALFGDENTNYVKPNVGIEQEYFLISKDLFEKRKDLIYTGRTLFGAKPPKNRDSDANTKTRISKFSDDLSEELYHLGILLTVGQNENAPSQYEIATFPTPVNVASDTNHLVMEIMEDVAKKHEMKCLLHEKPFSGINGSGKHNTWSLVTSSGTNLFDIGETPSENARFLLFFCAVIKAVDDYKNLFRIFSSGAGNDSRLGSFEAPPASVFIYTGEEIEKILSLIENHTNTEDSEFEKIKIGEDLLPDFEKNVSDINRTAPIAFTGGKFEFRMPGAPSSVSDINTVLNTAVAESLRLFADELEDAGDFTEKLNEIISHTITRHKKIIYNGDGYENGNLTDEENENPKTTPDSMAYLLSEKNIKLFDDHSVFSESELKQRYKIMLENYIETLRVEALTMIDMINRDILPSMSGYTDKLLSVCKKKKEFEMSAVYELSRAEKLSALSSVIYKKTTALEDELISVSLITDLMKKAQMYKSEIFVRMQELRASADEAETVSASEFIPFPTYGDLLFGIK